MDAQIQLDILKDHWMRHILQNLLTAWMNTDKQAFTHVECKKINDTFVEAHAILQALNVNSQIEFVTFLEKMNELCALINQHNVNH